MTFSNEDFLGPSDGIGGCFKYQARMESLRKRSSEMPITDAVGFYNFVSRISDKTVPMLITHDEIQQTAKRFKVRWKNAKVIHKTQTYHDFRVDPNNSKFIYVRHISASEEIVLRVRSLPDNLEELEEEESSDDDEEEESDE